MARLSKKNPKYCNREVVDILAAEFDLSPGLIDQVIASQSALTKEKIMGTDYAVVKWPMFGKFVADPRRIAKVNGRKGLPKVRKNKAAEPIDDGSDLLNFDDL